MQTSDPVIIEAALADTVEPQLEDFATATVATVATDGAGVAEQPIGYALLVPGKEEAYSVHQSLDEWADAYEELANKTARAGKRPARERMTILKELRLINEDTIGRIDMVKRIRHTASYAQRIKALGASQG